MANSLTIEEALEANMTWKQVIKTFRPKASDEEVEKIYLKARKKAERDAVVGRRPFLADFMIFDRIKYDICK